MSKNDLRLDLAKDFCKDMINTLEKDLRNNKFAQETTVSFVKGKIDTYKTILKFLED